MQMYGNGDEEMHFLFLQSLINRLQTLARALTLEDTKKCTYYHKLMFLHLKKKCILSYSTKYIM
jgi:hypothetical protein